MVTVTPSRSLRSFGRQSISSNNAKDISAASSPSRHSFIDHQQQQGGGGGKGDVAKPNASASPGRSLRFFGRESIAGYEDTRTASSPSRHSFKDQQGGGGGGDEHVAKPVGIASPSRSLRSFGREGLAVNGNAVKDLRGDKKSRPKARSSSSSSEKKGSRTSASAEEESSIIHAARNMLLDVEDRLVDEHGHSSHIVANVDEEDEVPAPTWDQWRNGIKTTRTLPKLQEHTVWFMSQVLPSALTKEGQQWKKKAKGFRELLDSEPTLLKAIGVFQSRCISWEHVRSGCRKKTQ